MRPIGSALPACLPQFVEEPLEQVESPHTAARPQIWLDPAKSFLPALLSKAGRTIPETNAWLDHGENGAQWERMETGGLLPAKTSD